MPGYEDLTPDQIMTIMWLIVIAVSIFIVGGIAKSLINLKVAKCIKFNIEKEVVKQIAKDREIKREIGDFSPYFPI